MPHNINPIKQDDNYSCSITCASMILKSVGMNRTPEDIKNDIKERFADYIPFMSIALYLLELGLDVTTFSYNMYYLDPEQDKGAGNKELLDRVLKRTDQGFFKNGDDAGFHQTYISLIKEALSTDIDFKIERPSIEMIDKELKKNRAVIIEVNDALWYGYGHDPVHTHAILIGDEKDDSYIVLDPGHGKEFIKKKEDILFMVQNRRVVAVLNYAISVGLEISR